MTDAKKNIIEQVRPNTANFFEEVFVYGGVTIPYAVIHIINGNLVIPTRDLFHVYQEWCKESGIHCAFKETSFCTTLYKFPGINKYGTDGRVSINRRQVKAVIIGQQYYSSGLVEKVTTGVLNETETFPISTIINCTA